MAQPLSNYLRTYRKRSGLSQREVAFVLGCTSEAKVSRYEHGERLPSLESLFALEVIYGIPARELYAGVFDRIQRHTLKRINRLAERIQRDAEDRRHNRKLALLLGALGKEPNLPQKS
jgi:transcriptional regulator with XRE-family HTH domain